MKLLRYAAGIAGLICLPLCLLGSRQAAAHEADLMPERAPLLAPTSDESKPQSTSAESTKVEQIAIPASAYSIGPLPLAANTQIPMSALMIPEAKAAQPAPAPESEKIALTLDDPMDPPTVAYDITMSWMKSDEWTLKVKALKAKFKDWESNTGGDIGQYLNDRLLLVALSAASGKVDSLKNGFVWLAYYKEFNQQVPNVVSTVLRDHKTSLERLFKDFTWERASQYVKNKEWRNDIPKKQ